MRGRAASGRTVRPQTVLGARFAYPTGSPRRSSPRRCRPPEPFCLRQHPASHSASRGGGGQGDAPALLRLCDEVNTGNSLRSRAFPSTCSLFWLLIVFRGECEVPFNPGDLRPACPLGHRRTDRRTGTFGSVVQQIWIKTAPPQPYT